MSLLTKANRVRKEEGIFALCKKITLYLSNRYLNKIYLYRNSDNIKMDTPAGSIKFHPDPEWNRLQEISTGGIYESHLLNELHKSFSKDDVFYNVGARWGIFSLFAKECGIDGKKIHNFEADELNFDILNRNVRDDMINNRVYVSNSDDENNVTLDSYSKTHDTPTIIKIDIEGAELNAIQGAIDVLSKQKPELYIEIHPEYIRDFGGDQRDLINILRDNDYAIQKINHRSNKADWESIDFNTLPSDGDYLLHAI